MKRFNLIPKLVRITLILSVAVFIIITIPVLYGSISPPSEFQNKLPYGVNKTDIIYRSSYKGETDSDPIWRSPGRKGNKITGNTFEQVASYSDSSDHRSSFVTVGGLRVHYLDWRGSGPAMLLVPGAGNTAHVFDDFAPRFIDDYRVVAITCVGFGESDKPSGLDYSLAERVAHMRARPQFTRSDKGGAGGPFSRW